MAEPKPPDLLLYPWPCALRHYPQLVSAGEGQSGDLPVSGELYQLLYHHRRPVHSPHYCWRSLHHSLVREQDLTMVRSHTHTATVGSFPGTAVTVNSTAVFTLFLKSEIKEERFHLFDLFDLCSSVQLLSRCNGSKQRLFMGKWAASALSDCFSTFYLLWSFDLHIQALIICTSACFKGQGTCSSAKTKFKTFCWF